MKRWTVLFILALLLCGCQSDEPAGENMTMPETTAIGENCTTRAEAATEPVTELITEPVTEPVTESITEPVTEPPVTDPPAAVKDERVQYIRTDGWCELFPTPHLVKIESRSALEAYFYLFAGIYDLESRPEHYSDYTIGWADAIEMYDDAFFDDSLLYMAVLEEGSGSIRHQFLGIEDGYAQIGYLIPEEGTDDMALWHIFIPSDAELLGLQGEDKTVIYTPVQMEETMLEFLSERAMLAVVKKVGEAHYVKVNDITRMTWGEACALDISNPYGYGAQEDSPIWQLRVEAEGWEFVLYLNHRGTFAGEAASNPFVILESK